MNLKLIRLQRHLSQEVLAKLSGLNVRTIQRIENGNSASVESLKCLAAALDIDVADLSNNIDTSDTDKVSAINMLKYQANHIFYLLSVALIFVVVAANAVTAGANSFGALLYLMAGGCLVISAYKMVKHRLGMSYE
ncbi:helix-turn-helix domain-containing protein [Agaribacter marinus]|uniref:HTH cro/C1-type domain-containing protein n=1 Tax=Agaribacter marinus TaxID=1431249 RepID=A0AA37SVZ0_9ALTE|nr:helix-turn-helix transcriptional regulator [Agaribacter marinus]GLR69339.1 hypothetical protein GCM10007852_02470 [Agaribacter marinus]